MGRELTRQYPLLSEPLTIRNLRRLLSMSGVLLREIYRSGKLRELTSFAVWELRHQLGLFPRDGYLKFDSVQPLSLDDQQPSEAVIENALRSCLASRGLRLTRAAQNWKLLFLTDSPRQLVGCIYPDDTVLYRSDDDGATMEEVARFPERIKAVFVSSRHTAIVATIGAVYRGPAAGGAPFTKVCDLSSPASVVRHNNEITETRTGTLMVGEYGNVWDEKAGWRSLAYLHFSADDGATWERTNFLVGVGTNKHVHVVKYSTVLDKMLVADGDNRKRFWVSKGMNAAELRDRSHWTLINRFHVQVGGYTSAAEVGGRVLLGTDYQGGTNFMVETTDGAAFAKKVVPDPYRRSPIDNMVSRRSRGGTEVWANLPFSTARTKCLLMVSHDAGREWHRIIEYNEKTHKVWMLSAARDSADEIYLAIENRRTHDRVVWRVHDA
jgi:hypothetical protein